MPRFADSTGRTWNLDLTVGDIKRIRRRMGIDLMGLLDGEPRLVDRIRDDLELAINLVFAAIEPQAEAAGVTDEQFGHALTGEAASAALAALWGAVADFFRFLRPAATAAAERVMMLRRTAGAILAMMADAGPMPSGDSSIGQPGPADLPPTA